MKAGDIEPSGKRSLNIVLTIFRKEGEGEAVRLVGGGDFICTVRGDGKPGKRLHPKLHKYLRGLLESNDRW